MLSQAIFHALFSPHLQKKEWRGTIHCTYRFTGSYESDAPVMPQLVGEALRVEAIRVSLEWCVIDKTALRQFVNNGALFMCRFEWGCVRQHTRKQAIKIEHTPYMDHGKKKAHTHSHKRSTISPSLLHSACQSFFICPSSVPYSSEWLRNHFTWREEWTDPLRA